ncbi:MAG: hypothetical protein U1D30_15010 [Planctomycetota bacterium]
MSLTFQELQAEEVTPPSPPANAPVHTEWRAAKSHQESTSAPPIANLNTVRPVGLTPTPKMPTMHLRPAPAIPSETFESVQVVEDEEETAVDTGVQTTSASLPSTEPRTLSVRLAARHVANPIPASPPATMTPAMHGTALAPAGEIQQVGCASCGTSLFGNGGFTGVDLYSNLGSVTGGTVGPDNNCTDAACNAVDATGCCAVNCYPGMAPCYESDDSGHFKSFLALMYEVICCPDPFYDLTGPHWIPAANAAIFVEHAQPRSQTRFRWDAGQGMKLPDRNEYFFAQANGTGLGPNPIEAQAERTAEIQQTNPGYVPPPPTGINWVNYDDLSMYIETATKNGKFSMFVNTPYRSVDPDVVDRHAFFGDMDMGTKSLVFDRELIQISFQFRTYMPTGVSFNGTGTGHFTIEPSVLYNIKLLEDCYLEGQVTEWIPLGGSLYDGGIFITHHSVNKVLLRINPDVSVIGTGELNSWWFQAGMFTDPATLQPKPSSGGRYYTLGPGVRINFRNIFDVGAGCSFAVSNNHFAEQLYRLEARLMY